MTTSELNKICCDFAGIEPKNSNGAGVAWYPPVSTDWEAAGRLTKALESKGVRLAAQFHNLNEKGVRESAVRIVGSNWGWNWAPDFPMALCLAVAEFAKESAR